MLFGFRGKRLEARRCFERRTTFNFRTPNGRAHESFLKGSLRENFFSKKFSLNNASKALKGAGKTRVFPALPFQSRALKRQSYKEVMGGKQPLKCIYIRAEIIRLLWLNKS